MLISTDDSPVKVFVMPTGEDMVLNEDVASILGWRGREVGPGAAVAAQGS